MKAWSNADCPKRVSCFVKEREDKTMYLQDMTVLAMRNLTLHWRNECKGLTNFPGTIMKYVTCDLIADVTRRSIGHSSLNLHSNDKMTLILVLIYKENSQRNLLATGCYFVLVLLC